MEARATDANATNQWPIVSCDLGLNSSTVDFFQQADRGYIALLEVKIRRRKSMSWRSLHRQKIFAGSVVVTG